MNIPLILAFIFFAGSLIGWGLEFCFRNLISHKGPKYGFFINPGFCRGPYLPIYGVGMVTMFVVSYLLTPDVGVYAVSHPVVIIMVVIGIGICMSLIELIGGWMLLKFCNMRLWDYRDKRFNIKGYICLEFSLIWMTLGAIYYLVIHPLVIDGLIWLSNNLAFSFFIGLFFGFFIIDLYLSNMDAKIVKEFGNDNEVIIKYDELKALVQQRQAEKLKKTTFFNQTHEKGMELKESLREHLEAVENKLPSIEEKLGKIEEKMPKIFEKKMPKIFDKKKSGKE